MKTVNPESDIRILKVASCQSVSGKSTLTYHIGCTAESEIHLRVYANTAAGFFSKEWLSLNTIQETLTGKSFTSFNLQSLFRGKSMNNPAFLLAVLLNEGLIKRSADKKRCYEKVADSGFMAEIKDLMDSETDDKPPKKKEASVTSSTKKPSAKTGPNSPP